MGAAGEDPESGVKPVRQAGKTTLWFRAFLSSLVEHWFMLGLAAAICLAAAWPELGTSGGLIQSQYTIKYPAVIIIFLLTGMGLKTRVLVDAATHWRLHLLAQLLSFGVIPLVGWGIADILYRTPLDTSLVSGIIILCAMPTTVSTNTVFTNLAGGNEAAAVINSIIGNIAGIFITPMLLRAYLHKVGQPDFGFVLKELTITIIIPCALGQLAQYVTPGFVKWLQKSIKFGNVNSSCILLLVYCTFCTTFAGKLHVGAASIFAIVVLNLAMFIFFLTVCFVASSNKVATKLLRLDRADTVAVTLVGATKTVAMGVPLIQVLYGSNADVGLLSSPLIVYHALQIGVGSLLLKSLKAWRDKERNPSSALEPLLEGPSSPPGAGGGASGTGRTTCGRAFKMPCWLWRSKQ